MSRAVATIPNLRPVDDGTGKRRRLEREASRLCDDLEAETASLDLLLHARTPDQRTVQRVHVLAQTERRVLDALGIDGIANDDRMRLSDVARSLPVRTRVPWHGGPMTLTWALQSQLASTWALADELAERASGDRRPASPHIVDLALTLLPYNFLLAGRPAPEGTMRVDLSAPGAATWASTNARPGGAAESGNVVSGPALDFCRLACGRTTRSGAAIVAHGDVADAWLDVVDALAYSTPLDTGR